jgi:putative transposase
LGEARRRHSIRLPDYDYSSAGAYFVTICTREKELLFERREIRDVVDESWQSIPKHFPRAGTDAFVVMPNHVHGVIWILDPEEQVGATAVGAQHAAPLQQSGVVQHNRLQPGSLGVIVRSFKSAVTKGINELRDTPGEPVWQRNYYERVVRNDDELNRIREYIQLNPLKWNLDRDNPMRVADEMWDKQWGWLEGEQALD